MYPSWLIDLFQGNLCSECKTALTIADVESIGVRRPYPSGPPWPLAKISCVCGHCGNRMECTIDQPLESILPAVECLYREIADAAPPRTGFFQIPSPNQMAPSAERENAPARPSCRKDQPLTPPTEQEINVFLARLRKMSFKAGSRSLKKLTGENEGD
jgi:hypothetical protein